MKQAVICPTITAFDEAGYAAEIERVQSFARQIHVDLMDGEFTPTVSPGVEKVWWPPELIADIHLMYQRPLDSLAALIRLHPRMVVIHAEADVDHALFARELHNHGIQAGLALLQPTAVESVSEWLPSFDQALVFSGDLGKHGGAADLNLLDKVVAIRDEHPSLEIAWDGGITADNAAQLVAAGVNVLNVGGFIQKSADPAASYDQIVRNIS